jgi:hypothetical protein
MDGDKLAVFFGAVLLFLSIQYVGASIGDNGPSMANVSLTNDSGAGNNSEVSRFSRNGSMGNLSKRLGDISVNPVCVVNAIDRREDSLIAATDQYASAMKSAFGERRSALDAARDIRNGTLRRDAIKAAWSTFNGDWKNATSVLRTAKKNAWAQYGTSIKACNTTPEDASYGAADQNLFPAEPNVISRPNQKKKIILPKKKANTRKK